MAYVLDPRAHPSDQTVTYNYAADPIEDVRKTCTIGRMRTAAEPEAGDWI